MIAANLEPQGSNLCLICVDASVTCNICPAPRELKPSPGASLRPIASNELARQPLLAGSVRGGPRLGTWC